MTAPFSFVVLIVVGKTCDEYVENWAAIRTAVVEVRVLILQASPGLVVRSNARSSPNTIMP